MFKKAENIFIVMWNEQHSSKKGNASFRASNILPYIAVILSLSSLLKT